MGAKLVPEHPLRRLFPVILTAVPMAFVFSDHSLGVRVKVFSPALFLKASNSVLLKFGLCRIYISIILSFHLAAVCALRSGRTERRMIAGLFTFQLAAVCALRSGRMERRMTAGFKGVS